MTGSKIDFEFTIERWGLIFNFRSKGEFLSGDPGRISGPPENCYPPEAAEYNCDKLWLVSIEDEKNIHPFEEPIELNPDGHTEDGIEDEMYKAALAQAEIDTESYAEAEAESIMERRREEEHEQTLLRGEEG